jgi:hypothetical protein
MPKLDESNPALDLVGQVTESRK